MFTIQRVKVNGFRNSYAIDVTLHRGVNFFVGRNGTGKTTLINIIVAALQFNFSNLLRLPFKDVAITLLSSSEPDHRMIIEIIRNDPPDIDNTMTMKITEKKSKNSDEESYLILENGKIVLSGDEYSRVFPTMNTIFPEGVKRFPKGSRGPIRRSGTSLSERFRSVINTSWLSINRAEFGIRDYSEKLYESTIDQKLKQIYNDIPRYFSLLDARANSEFRQFQETYFLSLLFDDSISFNIDQVNNLQVDTDRDELENIFINLKLQPYVFRKKLDEHFTHFNRAKQFINEKSGDNFSGDDHRAIIDTVRIHKVVEKWREYQKTRNYIYLPKSRFENILTGLYIDKDVIINERNAPVVRLRKDKEHHIPLSELSSGEKQLFIIIGECLLQEGKPWIYVADEPELSLHMEWQLNLVSSLRQINESGQIIFATHSPEILGEFSDNTFDMGEICK